MRAGDFNTQEYVEMTETLTNTIILEHFCIARGKYNTQQLVLENPVSLYPKKVLVYSKACPEGCVHQGELIVSRYAPIPLSPYSNPGNTILEMREDTFDYLPSPAIENKFIVDMWVNFADEHLFVAYASRLFAQDEIQVAEHPSLGHLKEKLRKEVDSLIPLTRERGKCTPIIIRNIERRCSVAVDVNSDEARPRGLYGNTFAESTNSTILTATKVLTKLVIDPPTITHMIAMASLRPGSGCYSWAQVVDLYTTAYTSFKAAAVEAYLVANKEDLSGDSEPYLTIHTGNWGCGAFGGSKPLMALLQCLAAQSAGVHKLVYHTFNKEGSQGYERGIQELEKLGARGLTVKQILEQCCNNTKFIWGTSDGN